MLRCHRGKNLFGISTGFISDPYNFTLDSDREMGDFYRLMIPGHDIFIISKPELLRHFTATNGKNYRKGRIYWKQLARGIGEGIATTDGPQWLFRRRMMQPHFTKKRIDSYVPDMAKIIANYYESMISNQRKEIIADVMELGHELTASVTLYNLLGVDASTLPGFYQRIKRSQEFIFYCSRYPWRRFLTRLNGKKRQFEKDVRYFDRIIFQIIRQRRNSEKPSCDLLSTLANARDEGGKLVFSEKQIRDEFITLLGGGSENSSACFTWTLYLLWKNPEKLAILRNEIDPLFDSLPVFNEELLQKMKYTENVINESLRMYPPGYAIVREAKEKDVMENEVIPKGATLYFATNVVHHDVNYWKDPENFRPERFRTGEEIVSEREDYFPFGSGQHSCIGSHFAIAELKIMLGILIHRYDFTIAREEPVIIESRMTPHPLGGLPFLFKPRAKKQQDEEIENIHLPA